MAAAENHFCEKYRQGRASDGTRLDMIKSVVQKAVRRSMHQEAQYYTWLSHDFFSMSETSTGLGMWTNMKHRLCVMLMEDCNHRSVYLHLKEFCEWMRKADALTCKSPEPVLRAAWLLTHIEHSHEVSYVRNATRMQALVPEMQEVFAELMKDTEEAGKSVAKKRDVFKKWCTWPRNKHFKQETDLKFIFEQLKGLKEWFLIPYQVALHEYFWNEEEHRNDASCITHIPPWPGLDAARRKVPVPDCAVDKHTEEGRRLGRGSEHFRKVGAVTDGPVLVPHEYQVLYVERAEDQPPKKKVKT